MERRTARGNRLGLALLGVPLLAIGGYALARGLGGFGAARAEDRILLPEHGDYFAANRWLWWVIAALALVLALLGLRWLLAQSRRETLSGLRLEQGRDGTTEVEAAGVADALETDLTRHPAVQRAHADLTGTGTAPSVRLRLVVAEDTPLDVVRDHLDHRAIPRMRQALEVEHLPTVVRLGTGKPAPRGRSLT